MESFREFLEQVHMGQSECSRRFGIPLRTVQSWAEGQRTPPRYLVEMMAKIIELENNKGPQ